MLARTHIPIGMIAGLQIASGANPHNALASAAIAGMASLLPDLDDPKSRIGHAVPVAPTIIHLAVGHRGLLHSILGTVLILSGFSLVVYTTSFHYFQPILVLNAILAGYLSHLTADSFNGDGVPWLYPLKKRIGIPLVKVGGILERLVIMPSVWLIAAIMLFHPLRSVITLIFKHLV